MIHIGEACGWWRGAQGGRAGIRDIQPRPPATKPAIHMIGYVVSHSCSASIGPWANIPRTSSARVRRNGRGAGHCGGWYRRNVSGPADSVAAVAVNSPLRRQSQGMLFRCLRLVWRQGCASTTRVPRSAFHINAITFMVSRSDSASSRLWVNCPMT